MNDDRLQWNEPWTKISPKTTCGDVKYEWVPHRTNMSVCTNGFLRPICLRPIGSIVSIFWVQSLAMIEAVTDWALDIESWAISLPGRSHWTLNTQSSTKLGNLHFIKFPPPLSRQRQGQHNSLCSILQWQLGRVKLNLFLSCADHSVTPTPLLSLPQWNGCFWG